MNTSSQELIWAGTQNSYDAAVEADSKIMAGPMGMPDTPDQEDPLPWNLSIHGEVGIVRISGSMSNSDSPYARYYGITTYSDIRQAVITAAQRSDVKAILLDISSGGGAVSGVDDTAKLVAMIDASVKPVYSYTEGIMASAAYWVGSSARQVFASSTAIVGSVGVIATLMEQSKALKEAGIGVSVRRAGEFKALISSVEPHTEKALAQVDSQLNAVYGVFINHVAERRKTTVALADANMGQGREFVGQQALAAGLIDGVSTFDAVLSRINQQLLDTDKVTLSNNRNHFGLHDMKQSLTEQQIAALAAGAAINATAAPEVPDAAAAASATAEAAAAAAAAAAAEAAAEAAAPAAAVAPAVAPAADNAVLAFAQAQIKETQAEVVDLKVQLAAANQKLVAAEATHDGLRAIAAQSVSNMKVALGYSGFDASTLSAEALLQEHQSSAVAFNKAFKAGGVAAVSTTEQEEKPAAPVAAAFHQAALGTIRFSQK